MKDATHVKKVIPSAGKNKLIDNSNEDREAWPMEVLLLLLLSSQTSFSGVKSLNDPRVGCFGMLFEHIE